MKNTIILLVALTLCVSCKKETKPEATETLEGRTEKQSDGLTLLKGDFMYIADAAVLQTHREIYGVVIDEKMHELNEMVKPYKEEEYDWVPVEVRGKITKKAEGEEGWDYKVEIEEILGVSAPDKNKDDIIKIGK
jgi:hypothetical protein